MQALMIQVRFQIGNEVHMHRASHSPLIQNVLRRLSWRRLGILCQLPSGVRLHGLLQGRLRRCNVALQRRRLAAVESIHCVLEIWNIFQTKVSNVPIPIFKVLTTKTK